MLAQDKTEIMLRDFADTIARQKSDTDMLRRQCDRMGEQVDSLTTGQDDTRRSIEQHKRDLEKDLEEVVGFHILPICGGFFAGPFKQHIPRMTFRCLSSGFQAIPDEPRRYIQQRIRGAPTYRHGAFRPVAVEISVYAESMWDVCRKAAIEAGLEVAG